MRKSAALVWAFLGFACAARAQRITLTGSIRDTAEQKPVARAVVAAVRAKDSILLGFTRSDAEGRFSFSIPDSARPVLLVTFPGFADFVRRIDSGARGSLDLGVLPLVRRSQLLKEVVVRGNYGAIRIKGDTTEFVADSFKVRSDATVEDLLKQLPGIQVDNNGKITAQGKSVSKVLVDGEEFFGDDPTLVTQNLRANMIDKVQLYDKTSDKTDFTGVDDGKRDKTLNLTLKADKKNGYFGKLEAGVSPDGYHNHQAMLNYFRNRMKIAGYGIFSNTGKTGLNWQESDKFGQSIASSLEMDETGVGFIFTGNNDDLDDWNGQYNGQGYPNVKTGGMHFNDKWNADKTSLNLNYKYMDFGLTGISGTKTQTILPDTVFYSTSDQDFRNHIIRNRADATAEMALDSFTTLKLTASGGTDRKDTRQHYHTQSMDADSALVNDNDRVAQNHNDIDVFSGELLLKRKFAKKRRTLAFDVKENFRQDNSTGHLGSDTRFYEGGAQTSEQFIDQQKNYHSRLGNFQGTVSYTEPLSRVSVIAVNYGFLSANSASNRKSYNKSADGKYDDLDSLYSNDYRYDVLTHQTGALYSYIGKKLKWNIGSNVGLATYGQDDLDSGLSVRRHFVNWYPRAMARWTISQQFTMMFRYNGQTIQPTIEQIQPIRNNQDPLNVALGNPSLKPAFDNQTMLDLWRYDPISESGFSLSSYYNFAGNAISSSDYVDSVGRRTYQSINVAGNYSLNLNGNYSWKWKKPGIGFTAGPSLNINRNRNVVNGLLNTTKAQTTGVSLEISKSKQDKFNLWLNLRGQYTDSRSSLQEQINTHYWTWRINPEFEWNLPAKFLVKTNAEIGIRQRTPVFTDHLRTVFWNASVEKKFTKKQEVILRAAVNDILNQNIGFERDVNSNYITQNTWATIHRYILFSVIWNFTRSNPSKPAP